MPTTKSLFANANGLADFGKALPSRLMHDARRRGAEAFFLGATPSGFPRYERLGYTTVADCPIWVRGVTHQA